MLKLSGISLESLFRVCLSGFRADAAVTRRPVGAGCQRSPPSLHSCFCRLGHRAGHPAHHTHSLPVGTYWKTAHSTYRKFWNMCRVSSKSSFTYVSVHFQQGEHGLDEHKLHVFLSALQSLIPPLFAVVLQNAPFTSRVKLHGDIPAIEGRRDNIVTVLGGFLKFSWPSCSVSAVTRFPRPASPLQDVATIIGSREMLSALLLLYDHQLEHEGTTGWESLLWVVNQLWDTRALV